MGVGLGAWPFTEEHGSNCRTVYNLPHGGLLLGSRTVNYIGYQAVPEWDLPGISENSSAEAGKGFQSPAADQEAHKPSR